MWNVIETLKEGGGGVFGPFETYRDAVQFLLDSEYPWTSENMRSVTIEKEISLCHV